MASFATYPLHGGQLKQIAEQFGVPASELLDFSANINPDGPPASVLSTLRTSLDDPATLTAYPDLELTNLKQAIARYAGTNVDHVIVANGFVPLLEATLRTLRIGTCLLPVPAFVEYRKTLERMDVKIVPHALSSGSCFQYHAATLLTGQQQAILLANPQNPSGVCHDAIFLNDLVQRALDKNMYVLLDEAFIDYVPQHSLSTKTDQFSNLIVFRSVTKFHGIPGLRVAYAIANPALSATISDNLSPWPITTLASQAVIAALSDHEYAVRTRSENQARRSIVERELEPLGLQIYPTSANFLLFRLPTRIDPDLFWQKMIVEHRIVLRSCANYDGLTNDHFRAAIRTHAENSKLVAAVAAVVRALSIHSN